MDNLSHLFSKHDKSNKKLLLKLIDFDHYCRIYQNEGFGNRGRKKNQALCIDSHTTQVMGNNTYAIYNRYRG
jgi:hypothetical protein